MGYCLWAAHVARHITPFVDVSRFQILRGTRNPRTAELETEKPVKGTCGRFLEPCTTKALVPCRVSCLQVYATGESSICPGIVYIVIHCL